MPLDLAASRYKTVRKQCLGEFFLTAEPLTKVDCRQIISSLQFNIVAMARAAFKMVSKKLNNALESDSDKILDFCE